MDDADPALPDACRVDDSSRKLEGLGSGEEKENGR
jgi:hypothetical protein